MCGLKIQTFEKLSIIRDQQEKSDDAALTWNVFEINRTQIIRKEEMIFYFSTI